MTAIPPRPAAPSGAQERHLALLIGGLGVALYFGLAFFPWNGGQLHNGEFIYNYYFLSLIEGAFDIPPRIAAAEGHYDQAGRAFVYHGLAPLVTRAFAWPFIDLTQVSLTPLTTWLFAGLGTALYHVTTWRILHRFGHADIGRRRWLFLVSGVMVWIASPGPILVINGAFTQEPFAVAYATSAGMIAMLIDIALFGAPVRRWVAPCAAMAGITVHARPDLAVGLYTGVCLMGVLALWRDGARAMVPVGLALAVLGAFGAALMGFNFLRFGTPWRMHGATDHGAIEYGILFWGIEPVTSPRLVALAEHGTFNLHRILPNLMLYLADVPYSPPSDWLLGAFRRLTAELGYIRIGQPRLGLVFYWLPWCLLGAASLRYLPRISHPGWVLLIATGIGALLMLSYGTINLRYRINVWPVMVAMVFLGLPHMLRALSPPRGRWQKCAPAILGGATAISVAAMAVAILDYRTAYVNEPTSPFGPWPFSHCTEMVRQAAALSTANIDRVCDL